MISKIGDIKQLLARGLSEPAAAFPEIEHLAASDDWKEREVAATAVVEISKRHADVVVAQAKRWAKSMNPNLRRAASEGMRGLVKIQPEEVRRVLELLKTDGDLYVKKSVANVLRNAARKNQAFVLEVCHAWAASPNPHTRWIVKDGLRTIKHTDDAKEILGMLEASA